MKTGRVSVGVVGMLFAGSALLAGCSSYGGPSSSTAGGAGQASESVSLSAASCKANAAAALTRAEAAPHLALGPSFEMSKLAGKKVAYVADTMALPLISEGYTGLRQAASAEGIKTQAFDGQGTVSGQTTAFNEALVSGAAGIIYVGIDPKVVSSQLAEAKASGIATAAENFPGPEYGIKYNLAAMGKDEADYVVADSGCSARTLVVLAPGFLEQTTEADAFSAEETRLCGSACSMQLLYVEAVNVATSAGPSVTNALRKDPSIKYVFSIYDNQTLYINPAVQALGTGVKVVSAFADPALLKDYVVKQNTELADVVGPTYSALGWFDLDQIGRAMLHLAPSSADATLPVQLIDKSDLSDVLDLPTYADYQSQLKSTWSGK